MACVCLRGSFFNSPSCFLSVLTFDKEALVACWTSVCVCVCILSLFLKSLRRFSQTIEERGRRLSRGSGDVSATMERTEGGSGSDTAAESAAFHSVNQLRVCERDAETSRAVFVLYLCEKTDYRPPPRSLIPPAEFRVAVFLRKTQRQGAEMPSLFRSAALCLCRTENK